VLDPHDVAAGIQRVAVAAAVEVALSDHPPGDVAMAAILLALLVDDQDQVRLAIVAETERVAVRLPQLVDHVEAGPGELVGATVALDEAGHATVGVELHPRP